MTVLDKNKIDMIGYNGKEEQCSLGISDHLDWDNTDSHLKILQEKINAYLEYILSNQAVNYFKNKKIKKYKIVLYLKNKNDKIVDPFLNEISKQIRKHKDTILIVKE